MPPTESDPTIARMFYLVDIPFIHAALSHGTPRSRMWRYGDHPVDALPPRNQGDSEPAEPTGTESLGNDRSDMRSVSENTGGNVMWIYAKRYRMYSSFVPGRGFVHLDYGLVGWEINTPECSKRS